MQLSTWNRFMNFAKWFYLLSLLFVKSGEILSRLAHVRFVFHLLTIRPERGSVTEIAQYAESATRPKDVNIGQDATIVNANLWTNAFARPVSPHCATCACARARSRRKKNITRSSTFARAFHFAPGKDDRVMPSSPCFHAVRNVTVLSTRTRTPPVSNT